MTKENLRITLQKCALAGRSAECSWCQKIIYPGEYFYAAAHTKYPFCSAECFANWSGTRLVAPVDPDYASWFSVRESEHDMYRKLRQAEIDADRYAERQRAFKATHEPAKCAWCGKNISPGTCVFVGYHGLDLAVFCSRDCYADAHGARLLCLDDNGYDFIFDEKE